MHHALKSAVEYKSERSGSHKTGSSGGLEDGEATCGEPENGVKTGALTVGRSSYGGEDLNSCNR